MKIIMSVLIMASALIWSQGSIGYGSPDYADEALPRWLVNEKFDDSSASESLTASEHDKHQLTPFQGGYGPYQGSRLHKDALNHDIFKEAWTGKPKSTRKKTRKGGLSDGRRTLDVTEECASNTDPLIRKADWIYVLCSLPIILTVSILLALAVKTMLAKLISMIKRKNASGKGPELTEANHTASAAWTELAARDKADIPEGIDVAEGNIDNEIDTQVSSSDAKAKYAHATVDPEIVMGRNLTRFRVEASVQSSPSAWWQKLVAMGMGSSHEIRMVLEYNHNWKKAELVFTKEKDAKWGTQQSNSNDCWADFDMRSIAWNRYSHEYGPDVAAVATRAEWAAQGEGACSEGEYFFFQDLDLIYFQTR